MAGSSVPLAQRVPPVEMPAGAVVEEAISIHGGGIESYDFHALEVLQSLIESRAGGETGVSKVELLTGEAFQKAQAAGRWSQTLVDAAMATEEKAKFQRLPYPGRPPAALLLTDGKYTAGRDPAYLAPRFSQLSVLKMGDERASLPLCREMAHRGRGSLCEVPRLDALPLVMYSVVKDLLQGRK